MGYFVKHALTKADAKTIIRNVQKKDGTVEKKDQVFADIVGYEIGKTGSEKTIVLSKDHAVAFIVQHGQNGAIDNAKVGVRPGKNGNPDSYYLQAAGSLKSLKEISKSIYDTKGAVIKQYEVLAAIPSATSRTRTTVDNTAKLNKMREELAKKGVKFDVNF